MSVSLPIARKIVSSSYLDVFGALLILVTSLWRNFHLTLYENGAPVFNVPMEEIGGRIANGAFPLGILSIIGAVFSILSTRFIGKQKNLGNVIGVFTTISSGTIDYLFGNGSAVITYPLTFVIMNFAVFNWSQGERIRKIDFRYFLINGAGILIAFGMVYLGAYWFGGRTDTAFLMVVAITFGLSLGANFSSALKYEETWLSWMVYNLVQLTKALLQRNLANVAKYVFYLFNALVTLFDWKFNGDIHPLKESNAEPVS